MIILLGTRGQLIKMTPVMRELDRREISYGLVSANQHPCIIVKLLKAFNLKNPDLMIKWGKYYWSRLESIKDAIEWWYGNLKFVVKYGRIFFKGEDLIVIHGDTMSTLLGLIIGKLFHIKIAHIESGYRSYSLLHPFPEEIIRRLACKFSDILFAPSDWAVHNLRMEHSQIVNTKQNTIFDLLKTIKTKTKNKKPYIVVTIHRQETLYNYLILRRVLTAIHKASLIAPVKFIAHPLTEQKLKEYNHWAELEYNSNIELLPIQIYPDFMNLIANSLFVITDGGGLQEETYFFNKPCLLMRKRTEKQVGLNETAYLSEFDSNKIDYFFENYQTFKRKRDFVRYNPSKIIVDCLERRVL